MKSNFLGNNIRYLRKKMNMSQEDLSDKLGYKSFSSVQKWESGIADPTFKTVEKIADVFGVSMNDLTTKDLNAPLSFNDTKSRGVRIPVLGEVAAGIPIEAVEDIIDYEEISEDMAKRGEFFGLRINGDSMLPRICKGDVVIVRQQPDAETGDTVIVRINGDSATCKKLRKYADGALELISTNPSYEPLFYSVEQVKDLPVEIVGKVVENRQKY